MTESREQVLISRVIDGDCTDAEWREFETIADANPAAWRTLAQEQRDHQSLSMAVNKAVAVAECVPVPLRNAGGMRTNASPMTLRLRHPSVWGGWLAAAVIAIVAIVGLDRFGTGVNNSPIGPTVMPANHVSVATADEAWNAYLDKGRESGSVVAEVPTKILIESRPAPSGEGFELLYLRQVVERTTVPNLYEFTGKDERGLPAPTQYVPPPTTGAL